MARRAFYSFHYVPDNWRASQVRNMGAIDGNSPCTDNDWEKITRGGEATIKKWIADQMHGKSCVVVLIGAETAGRKWITHEIEKGWNDGKGVVGVYIHRLKNAASQQSTKGSNPFDYVTVGSKSMSSIVKAYDPPFSTSAYAYDHIKTNLAAWLDEAVAIRSLY